MQNRRITNKKPRFQQGGIMLNLARYTPMPFPSVGAVSASQEVSTTSSDDNDLFDMKDIADLLKEALPSDAKVIMSDMYSLMNQINAVDGDPFLSSQFRSALAGKYLQIRQRADEAKQNLATYTKIRDDIANKSSLGEAVMDERGAVYYKTKNGISSCSIDDIGGKDLLTYSELLSMRRQNMPFADKLLQVAGNATSSKDVIASIESIISHLGSDNVKGDAYASHIRGKVREGLEMLAEATSGLYKITSKRTSVDQEKINAAIRTVFSMLPRNQQNYIHLKSKQMGSTMLQTIKDMIDMRIDDSTETTVSQIRDYEEELAKSKGKGSGSGGDDGIKTKLNNMYNILEGLGYKELGAFNLGGADNNFTYYGFMTKGQLAFDDLNSETQLMNTTEMMKKANLPGLRWEDASFAGASIPFNRLGEFVMNGNSYTTISLPFIKDKKTGRVKPDFSRLEDANDAAEVLRENGITKMDQSNYENANKLVRNAGIDIQYDKNGDIVTNGYMKFVALNVSTGRETARNLEGVNSDLYSIVKNDDLAKKVEATTGVESDAPGLDMFNTKQVMDGVMYIPYYPNVFTMTTNTESPIQTNLPTGSIDDLIMYQQNSRFPYISPDPDVAASLYDPKI